MAMYMMSAVNIKNNQVPNMGTKTRGSKYAGQSIKPLPIHILTVGKTRSPGVQLIVKDYIDKLKPYCPVHDLRIKSNPKNSTEPRVQIENEETGFMNFIKSDDWVVMLDENGKDLRSEEMADMIGDTGNKASGSRLVFCIGGAYGHGLKLRERANVKDLRSEEMADMIGDAGNKASGSRLVFCIGGAYGHGLKLRERANVKVKLSSLVLNHEIALVVLVEQLYRAWTILKGQKYHH